MEALQAVITRVEDRNFGGLRNRVHWGGRMKSSRLMLLGVAVIAGGLAAYLATQRDGVVSAPIAAEPAVTVMPEARTQILVAKGAIGIGQRLTPDAFEWVDWPESAVRSEFITVAAVPDAATSLAGSTARFEFFPGEPIRQEKLMPEGAGGFLSALLDEGKRGVSVTINAEAASGGFVAPGDHVDVVLTRPSDMGQFSETVLHNVRVLAVNAQLGQTQPTEAAPTDPAVFTSAAIATLELDSKQAEVIMMAGATGTLSLALRSMSNFADATPAADSPANQAIRLSSPFWRK